MGLTYIRVLKHQVCLSRKSRTVQHQALLSTGPHLSHSLDDLGDVNLDRKATRENDVRADIVLAITLTSDLGDTAYSAPVTLQCQFTPRAYRTTTSSVMEKAAQDTDSSDSRPWTTVEHGREKTTQCQACRQDDTRGAEPERDACSEDNCHDNVSHRAKHCVSWTGHRTVEKYSFSISLPPSFVHGYTLSISALPQSSPPASTQSLTSRARDTVSSHHDATSSNRGHRPLKRKRADAPLHNDYVKTFTGHCGCIIPVHLVHNAERAFDGCTTRTYELGNQVLLKVEEETRASIMAHGKGTLPSILHYPDQTRLPLLILIESPPPSLLPPCYHETIPCRRERQSGSVK